MTSKKGIAITAAVLAGITAASFLAWLLPGDAVPGKATFVITDHKAYLDDVKSIHEVLAGSVAIEFRMMLDGEIMPAEYVKSAEATSTQTAMQISEFIASKPPTEWQESYILYGEALRSFNTYVAETQVAASLMEDAENGGTTATKDRLNESLERMEMLWAESAEYVKRSDAARPGQ